MQGSGLYGGPTLSRITTSDSTHENSIMYKNRTLPPSPNTSMIPDFPFFVSHDMNESRLALKW